MFVGEGGAPSVTVHVCVACGVKVLVSVNVGVNDRVYVGVTVFDGVWKDYPESLRMDDGVAARMDRLKAIGNGQVPAVAATAFALLVARGNT